MVNENRQGALRISTPVKVVLMMGIAYLVVWGGGLIFEYHFDIDFNAIHLGMTLHGWLWFLQVLAMAATATIASSLYFDRPLRRLREAMERAKEGDFLIRARINGDHELADLAEGFNQVLKQFTDLSVHKIQSEHDAIVADESLKYRKSLEEKGKLIERANKSLEQLVQDLALIYEIGQKVNTVIDLDHLYAHITETLRRYLQIQEFAIMVFDEKKDDLRVRAASGFIDNDEVLRTIFHKGEGISGMVAASGRKMYIRDTRIERRFLHYKGERLSRSISFLSIPLIYKREVLGVINFGRQAVGGFSSTDVKMLSLVANQVALAIANAQLYTKTRELAVKDELTGVHNRRYFQHMLQIEWKRAVRFHRELSVIMIDVDHFKKYNDTFGHLQGDQVLRQLGALLLKNLREVDTVARFGGEEFVLLLPDTDKHGAIAVAEKIRRLTEEQRFLEGSEEMKAISISAGIATYPDDVGEVEDLIDHADIALYRAKERGRNRVVCYASPQVAEEGEPAGDVADLSVPKKRPTPTLQ